MHRQCGREAYASPLKYWVPGRVGLITCLSRSRYSPNQVCTSTALLWSDTYFLSSKELTTYSIFCFALPGPPGDLRFLHFALVFAYQHCFSSADGNPGRQSYRGPAHKRWPCHFFSSSSTSVDRHFALQFTAFAFEGNTIL